MSPPRLIMSDTRPVDPQEAVVVEPAEVAGVKPAVVGEASRKARSILRAAVVGVRDHHLVVGDRHIDAGLRPSDDAELGLAVLPGVGGRPADDLATDLGLAVAVEHDDAEAVAERARPDGRQRRGDAPHDFSGARFDRPTSVAQQHRHGRRREHRGADTDAADQARRTRG